MTMMIMMMMMTRKQAKIHE